MNELIELVKLSKYAGERFDLIQAGGGNASVKLKNGKMLIKNSGISLSEIELNSGYSEVDYVRIASFLKSDELSGIHDKRSRDAAAASFMSTFARPSGRPSIETFLHALLKKYTLHVHPIAVNIVACTSGWKKILEKLFPNSALINYETPGVNFALELNNFMKVNPHYFSGATDVIFMQNHGLIVSSDSFESVVKKIEEIGEVLEDFLGINLGEYKITNAISGFVNSAGENNLIAWRCEDSAVMNILKNNFKAASALPFCPETLVYCGMMPLITDSLDAETLKKYIDKYFDLPKIVIYRGGVYILGQNIKKIWEIAEVFKFHILVLADAFKLPGEVTFLCRDEIAYLGNFESEKYRKGK